MEHQEKQKLIKKLDLILGGGCSAISSRRFSALANASLPLCCG